MFPGFQGLGMGSEWRTGLFPNQFRIYCKVSIMCQMLSKVLALQWWSRQMWSLFLLILQPSGRARPLIYTCIHTYIGTCTYIHTYIHACIFIYLHVVMSDMKERKGCYVRITNLIWEVKETSQRRWYFWVQTWRVSQS